jgi:hypothetical protein
MVGAIETGQRRILADYLPPLCRAFGVPLAKLLAGAEDQYLADLAL